MRKPHFTDVLSLSSQNNKFMMNQNMNLVLLAMFIFGLIISLNASPTLNKLESSVPCLGSPPPPESILKLQTNIYNLGLNLGLEKECLVNCSKLKLDPDYVEEVLRVRDLIQKGDIQNARLALFKITRARTTHKYDKYTDEPPFLDNVTVLINVIVSQFIADVRKELN